MTKQKCSICKGINIRSLDDLKEYNFCSDCNTAWLKKFPKPKYSEIYYTGKSSLASKVFSPVALMFYKLRGTYVDESKKELWIDVGAGEGNFLKTLDYKKKIGVEVSKSGRELMEKAGLKTLTNEQFLKAKGLKADVISFWHVIEHLENPGIYIKAAAKNLSLEGKLVIGIPNIKSTEFETFKGYWFHLAPLYHLWHFSPQSLEKLINQYNFKIDYIDYWAPEHHLTGLIQSITNATAGSENILHKLVKRQDRKEQFPLKSYLIALFWLTLGFPFILGAWIYNSLGKRSGTIVLVASLKNVKISKP